MCLHLWTSSLLLLYACKFQPCVYMFICSMYYQSTGNQWHMERLQQDPVFFCWENLENNSFKNSSSLLFLQNNQSIIFMPWWQVSTLPFSIFLSSWGGFALVHLADFNVQFNPQTFKKMLIILHVKWNIINNKQKGYKINLCSSDASCPITLMQQDERGRSCKKLYRLH